MILDPSIGKHWKSLLARRNEEINGSTELLVDVRPALIHCKDNYMFEFFRKAFDQEFHFDQDQTNPFTLEEYPFVVYGHNNDDHLSGYKRSIDLENNSRIVVSILEAVQKERFTSESIISLNKSINPLQKFKKNKGKI